MVGTGPGCKPPTGVLSRSSARPFSSCRTAFVESASSSASAPNCIRNAMSFCRSSFLKNADAALRSVSISRSWLPEVSTSRPMVSGTSVSRVKYLIS